MNSIPNICRQLGISHRQLSQLIGCDRSVVSRAAKGQRSLPLMAHLQLAELLISTRQQEKTIPANTGVALTAQEQKQVEDRLEELTYQQAILQRRIRQHRQKASAALLLTQLLAATTGPAAIQRQLLEEFASQRSRQFSPGLLALLEIKQQVLQQEMALLQALRQQPQPPG